ncbi:MAG: nidogen-like domain-containing protein [Dehalococcoidia bacterium]
MVAGDGSDACQANNLAANDDGSTAAIPLPFTLNFNGRSFGSLYVNNNGNLTFTSALSQYTPQALDTLGQAIIAPFFADVDTNGQGSGLLTYGSGTLNNQQAFCALWNGVGYYQAHADKLNAFQVILIDRGDTGSGNFDIEFNYNAIQWESGDFSGGAGGLGGMSAAMGYSSGDQSQTFQQPGSFQPGSFLDTNAASGLVHNSQNSGVAGRYIFPIRGNAPSGATDTGHVYANDAQHPVGGAFVQLCPQSGDCLISSTDSTGLFQFTGLANGSYSGSVNPPSGTGLNVGQFTVNVTSSSPTPPIVNDVTLANPQVPPDGTNLTPSKNGNNGAPTVFSGTSETFTVTACAGGDGNSPGLGFQVFLPGGVNPIQSGGLLAIPPPRSDGSQLFTGQINPIASFQGLVHIVAKIRCPVAGTLAVIPLDVNYIDPSGSVTTPDGHVIAGANVTLSRSDTPTGLQVSVTNGSAIMSPANQNNADTTDAAGRYGWDVIEGYYQVTAQKGNCTTMSQSSSVVFHITQSTPVTGLNLILICPLGDVNGDTQVNAIDALCVLRSVAGLLATPTCPTAPLAPPTVASVKIGGGQVSAVDALCILRGVARLSPTSVCPSLFPSSS